MNDEDLIGYLVDALDADDRVAVESYLRASPDAAVRLDQLRFWLAPLEADREPVAAPVGLAERTVARLAAHLTEHEPPAVPSSLRPLPRAPREAPETRTVGGRFRPDVLVACGIAIVTAGLLFSAIGKVRARNEMMACQNTLRITHTGLSGYADTHHDRYPQIGPNSTAESFAAELSQSGQVPASFRPVCPACLATDPTAPGPAAGYTYTLGYRAPSGDLVGPRRPMTTRDEFDLVPISADYPMASAAPAAGPVCPHAFGMNVLFAGGNVRVTTSALIGPNGDHIYQNVFGAVGAGIDRTDIVLGRPGDRP